MPVHKEDWLLLQTSSSYIPDFESKLFLDTVPNLISQWPTSEIENAERYLRDRAEMVRAGVARCPSWFQEELMRIDSRLRCWWDMSLKEDLNSRRVINNQKIPGTGKRVPREEWVIDRFQDEGIVEGLLRLSETEPEDVKASIRKSATGLLAKGHYYLTVLRFKPEGEFQLDRKLLDALRASDMQRYKSPAEFIKKRESEAEAKRKSIEADDTAKVLAKVDALSNKQIHEFMEVSRAIATGETITCHGEAEKFMDSIEEARKKTPPIPINKKAVRIKGKGHK